MLAVLGRDTPGTKEDETMDTKRQQYWKQAASEEAQRGNAVAAGLFALIGQPSDSERAAMPKGQRFTLTTSDATHFGGVYRTVPTQEFPEVAVQFSASYPLFLIREAMDRGADFEDLADGFGAGLGTCGGDWSGIRDSTPGAVTKMLERALNFLFS